MEEQGKFLLLKEHAMTTDPVLCLHGWRGPLGRGAPGAVRQRGGGGDVGDGVPRGGAGHGPRPAAAVRPRRRLWAAAALPPTAPQTPRRPLVNSLYGEEVKTPRQ